MYKLLNRTLVSAALFAAAIITGPAALAAPMVQGTVTDMDNSGYIAEYTNVTYVSGGTDALGNAILICIDMDYAFPLDGSVHTYTVLGSEAAPVQYPAASGRATDLFNYAVDTYYNSMVVNETGNLTAYQFSALMWEIQQDFNGTVGSLNAESGVVSASSIMNDGAQAYRAMVSDLHDNYATIAEGYRSTQYTISFLDDNLEGYQNMMMLTAASQVPEPGTLALSMLGGLAMWRRARRQRAQA